MRYSFPRSLGSEVWLMHNNKAVCGVIEAVRFVKFKSGVDFKIERSLSYTVRLEGKTLGDYRAGQLFSSKPELIDSL